MNNLPLLLDAREAIDYYHQHPGMTDAEKAYVVAFLSGEGGSNSQIREDLGIEKVYTVTHLKRAGTLSEEELTLWLRNPRKITLGHVRAVAKLPFSKREKLLRDLLHTRTPVHKFEAIAKGKEVDRDADIKRLETLMSDATGRPIKVRYNPAKRSGELTLGFFTLDDLDDVCKALGFDPSEQM
ncbi:transcriptional regulator (plasmid) [Klebsiella pneumoniae]|uniref:transcriptional regulator n=1 Tax=Klebsiella pneumoniae TaxID=573 RepID=UPI001C471212|nr:transcriptional regulator [Klebsiella pneumoniae]MBV7403118.1 transcriptional regulator [Klebsiella pneumoniae]